MHKKRSNSPRLKNLVILSEQKSNGVHQPEVRYYLLLYFLKYF